MRAPRLQLPLVQILTYLKTLLPSPWDASKLVARMKELHRGYTMCIFKAQLQNFSLLSTNPKTMNRAAG
jgi:hypothetical protein